MEQRHSSTSTPTSSVIPPPSQSALSLLTSIQQSPRSSSGCPSLDALLTPTSIKNKLGLAQGNVLELLGPPGIGKSRTALGFLLDQRFASLEGSNGAGRQVLLVDAEGSISPSMIESTASLYAAHNSHSPTAVKQVCEGVHYTVLNELADLIAFFHTLPTWLSERPQVTLVIIDSLSFHFRPSNVDLQTKLMITHLIQSTLATITSIHSVSIIITTQLTIKLFNRDGESTGFGTSAEGLLVPGLGVNWLGGPFWRVILYYDEDGGRHAHLMESPVPSRATYGQFVMDALGPCDIPLANSEEEEQEI